MYLRGKMSLTQEEAMVQLGLGQIIIYPTETFYALGCMATQEGAAEQIFVLKGRDRSKPLPILIAGWDMAYKYLRLDANSQRLARLFWPGPLSIVTEVCSSISALARNGSGRSAVRMTPHPVASALCLGVGAPLVSSSANFSGVYPVSRPDKLDPELTQHIPVLAVEPWPQGGLASTLVEAVGSKHVKVIRAGAITTMQLAQAGFDLIS